MMKAAFPFLLVFLFFTGCRTPKPLPASTQPAPGDDRLSIRVTAVNLSEDGTRVSSQNDEVLLLAYLIADSAAAPALVLSEYFVLDSANHWMMCNGTPAKLERENELCFVLVEIDTDKNKEQIEPVVRVNLAAMRKAWETRDVETYTKFLGDDDLLGVSAMKVKEVDRKTGTRFTVKGLHGFDPYQYDVIVDY